MVTGIKAFSLHQARDEGEGGFIVLHTVIQCRVSASQFGSEAYGEVAKHRLNNFRNGLGLINSTVAAER